jgi:hypothetical protein
MSNINFQRTYLLADIYDRVKEQAFQKLNNYWDYPNLIKFNDLERTVTFSTERLIPAIASTRPRVMLLFSNPHPHSIHQGMFLSPNTRGKENLFWPVMRDAGWLITEEENLHPEQLADICLEVKYEGPFELIFYCYYAFPTNYPDDIRSIFGREYFHNFIEKESTNEFRNLLLNNTIRAVVTFNKGIFNRVSIDTIDKYTKSLDAGATIRNEIIGIDKNIPIFLTYPTGWRFHKNYHQYRIDSLETIRTDIFSELSKKVESF